MKNLILVTHTEFKCYFDEIMEMCTNRCMATEQEIIIAINETSNAYAEIAKLVPVEKGRGVRYEYNEKLMNKYNINTCSSAKFSKIYAIVLDACKKSKLAEYCRKDKKAVKYMQKAGMLAAEELVKMIQL